MTIKRELKQDTEARSCNNPCCRKAMFITYSESKFVALGIQHVMCMRHIVTCGQPSSAILFPIISQMARKMLLNITRVVE